MATHNRIYIAPSHTKKVFANMKRQGKDFSGRVTPLFPTMVVQAQEKKSRRPKEKDTQASQSSVPSDPTNIADEAVTEEPSMKLKELIDFCTKLKQIVLDPENTKTAQAQEITSLNKRVKRLEKKGGSRTHKLKRLYRVGRSRRVVSSKEESLGDQEDASKQGRIDDINANKDIYLVNVDRDEDMFGVNDLEGDDIIVESEVADKDVILSVDEVRLAQALSTLKSAKVQEKGDVIKEPKQEQEQALTPIVSSQQPTQVKDKCKAKVEADYQLAQRLQGQEQEEFFDAEKAILFVQLLEKRRKFFAAKRAEEKRNKPPTKAQQRSIMTTYLKNMAGWKPKDLKNKSFENIQELFDKAMKRVKIFVDMDTELVKESSKKAEAETTQESSSKRAGEALEQESSKKQKMDDDKETEELKTMYRNQYQIEWR
ncbi:hypothetical protein Tco_0024259 [Tanacetum coccineum]